MVNCGRFVLKHSCVASLQFCREASLAGLLLLAPHHCCKTHYCHHLNPTSCSASKKIFGAWISAMSFTGQAIPSRRVALGGRSKTEETREQTLERTRLEREKRRRAKLEQRSATCIQVTCCTGSGMVWHVDRIRGLFLMLGWLHSSMRK